MRNCLCCRLALRSLLFGFTSSLVLVSTSARRLRPVGLFLSKRGHNRHTLFAYCPIEVQRASHNPTGIARCYCSLDGAFCIDSEKTQFMINVLSSICTGALWRLHRRAVAHSRHPIPSTRAHITTMEFCRYAAEVAETTMKRSSIIYRAIDQ